MENEKSPEIKEKAKNNRTLTLSNEEIAAFSENLITKDDIETLSSPENFINKTINDDLYHALPFIPDEFADLIIIDPPYNLSKNFNGFKFNSRSTEEFDQYLESWFSEVVKKLKPNGSLYLCGDWKCTSSLQRVLEKHLTVLNRITWQREKGRGASANWKNSMEDIWFAVKNPHDYYFDVESVKQKKRVIAPYRENGKPKDWVAEKEGNENVVITYEHIQEFLTKFKDVLNK